MLRVANERVAKILTLYCKSVTTNQTWDEVEGINMSNSLYEK